jgi:hypothetical protein
VQGISDIITIPGLVNVDFADVKAIMSNSGTAMLGVGVSSGKNRAEEAALVSRAASVCGYGFQGSGCGGCCVARSGGCAPARALQRAPRWLALGVGVEPALLVWQLLGLLRWLCCEWHRACL